MRRIRKALLILFILLAFGQMMHGEALAAAAGDCDGSGTVTLSEVQSAINMFMGRRSIVSCVDLDNNSMVSLSEVQKTIHEFLGTGSGTLSGNVYFWRGNFMPGSSTGTITPVVRKVLIYQVTSVASPTLDGFFTEIPTRLVATTTSDNAGYYQMVLPPGDYSVFVEEGSRLYANAWDGQGRVNPVTVQKGGSATRRIDIRYNSYY